MKSMIVSEASKANADIDSGNLDGLIYMMLRVDAGKAIPIYIAKPEQSGKPTANYRPTWLTSTEIEVSSAAGVTTMRTT